MEASTVTQQAGQLSFNVGGEVPDVGTLKVSGQLHVHRDLEKGTAVHLQIVDDDGQVVADGYGRCSAVTFKERMEEGSVVGTERAHTVKLT